MIYVNVRYAPKKSVQTLISVSTSKVRTVLPTLLRTVTVPSAARTILWSVNGLCKEVSVSEVKQG